MQTISNYIKFNEFIGTSGQPNKKQFKLIASRGYEVVINLAMHNKGALKKEDKIVSKLGMIYIHIPITWDAPEMDRLVLFLKILKTLRKENRKIFVHCIKNHRVSVFMYHYKKLILGKKNTELVAPHGYIPNKTWEKVLKAKLQ